jgi:hypothetical protein
MYSRYHCFNLPGRAGGDRRVDGLAFGRDRANLAYGAAHYA